MRQARLTHSHISRGLAARATLQAQRQTRLTHSHISRGLAARTTLHARVTCRRHVRIADSRARLASSAIGERLTARTARCARHTIGAVKARAERQAQITAALIVLRLRPSSTGLTQAPVAVFAHATVHALVSLIVRLLARGTGTTLAARVRDVHGAEVAAARAVGRTRDTGWLLPWCAVQALPSVRRVLTHAGIAACALRVGLLTSIASDTR